MSGILGYALGYEDGKSSAEVSRGNRELLERALCGARPVTVDQSYIDRLLDQISTLRTNSDHNYDIADEWEQKARQFRNEALYWRDQKWAPAAAEAEALREENALLRARLEMRNPDLAAEEDAHQKTHEEKQSLQCFRLVATAILDALLAGRADRPEFGELVAMVKEAADVIDRGGLFFGFSETPEKARTRRPDRRPRAALISDAAFARTLVRMSSEPGAHP